MRRDYNERRWNRIRIRIIEQSRVWQLLEFISSHHSLPSKMQFIVELVLLWTISYLILFVVHQKQVHSRVATMVVGERQTCGSVDSDEKNRRFKRDRSLRIRPVVTAATSEYRPLLFYLYLKMKDVTVGGSYHNINNCFVTCFRKMADQPGTMASASWISSRLRRSEESLWWYYFYGNALSYLLTVVDIFVSDQADSVMNN